MRRKLRTASYIALTCTATVAATSGLAAQAGPPAGLASVVDIQAMIESEGGRIGPAVWPGFRPDTIEVLYVVPDIGKLFAHHQATQPRGFQPYPGHDGWGWAGAGSVSFAPGHIAFLTASSDPAATLGLAVHEAFHEFQEVVAREGIALGRRENAFDVVTYPIFDARNEAAVALEGRLLRAAISAGDMATRRARVREFVAVRRDRQAHLPKRFASFEDNAELNEGLAQYTLVRSLQVWQAEAGFPWRAEAAAAVAEELGHLDDLMETGQRSVRRRFYTTGSAMGVLLDALAGDGWKQRLMESDVSVDDLLAEYAGTGAVVAAGELRRTVGAGLDEKARLATQALARRRTALRDSLLDRDGIRIAIEAPSGQVHRCGFDPQNTLVTPSGEILHTRWLRLCAGDDAIAEFDSPVVEYPEAGRYEIVVPGDVRFTAGTRQWDAAGQWPKGELGGVHVAADGVSLDLGKTAVSRAGKTWVLKLEGR